MVRFEKDCRSFVATLNAATASSPMLGATPTIPMGCHLVRVVGNVCVPMNSGSDGDAGIVLVHVPSGYTNGSLTISGVTLGASAQPLYKEGERVLWCGAVTCTNTSQFYDFAVDVKCHRKLYSGDTIYIVEQGTVNTMGKVLAYFMFVLEFSGHDD